MDAPPDQAKRHLRRCASACGVGLLASARALLGHTRREVICNSIALSIGALIVFPSIALVLDRRPVLEILSIAIFPETARAGDTVSLVWSTLTKRECDGEVNDLIVSSIGRIYYYAPVTTTRKEVGVKQDFAREFSIPTGISPGPAMYISHITRWCNPLQHIIWPIHETIRIPFSVVK